MEPSNSRTGEFITTDTDSGYVSHTLDSSLEAYPAAATSADGGQSSSLFMNEDALLEMPMLSVSDSADLVLLDDSSRSNQSVVIPFCEPFTYLNLDTAKEQNAVDHWVQYAVQNQQQQLNTPEKQIPASDSTSPDLFSDEEPSLERSRESTVNNSIISPPTEKYIHRNDNKILKELRGRMGGLCPPPSLTMVQLSVDEMLNRIEDNRNLFVKPVNEQGTASLKSLLFSGTFEYCSTLPWPQIMTERHHGLHHNRSKLSEEIEFGLNKYAQRYVGAETQCSCTTFEQSFSPSKRKILKQKWPAKSPGRRLSHLARRRISFSSSTLQTATHSSIVGSRARQILVDAKKVTSVVLPPKSPQKTGSKSPNKQKQLSLSFSGNSTYESSLERRPTKRALFTSPRKTMSPQNKRKRIDSSSLSDQLGIATPTDLLGIASTNQKLFDLSNSSFSSSAGGVREELSDLHKKKLQWAVYEALRLNSVNVGHAQFKVFASILARVTRRFLPSLASKAPRPEEGTSERMLRIARHYAPVVIKGHSVEEIINEHNRNRARMQKPQGYVGLDGCPVSGNVPRADKENILVPDNGRNVFFHNSSDKRRMALLTTKGKSYINENRIERIRKVISFDDNHRK